MIRCGCAFFILISIAFETNAQQRDIKFEDVTKADFELPLSVDSTINAVILFDIGEAVADPSWGTKLKRHFRIKIINQSAIDEWANVKVMAKNFKLSKLKGFTYNLENGKIVKSVLSTKYEDETSEFDEASFTFSDVREGSIIEYSYVINFGEFGLPPWTFQHSVPILWSGYTLRFPINSYYSHGFRIAVFGDFMLEKYEVENQGQTTTWIMKNLPAFKPEPLMPNEDFFKSRISFDYKPKEFNPSPLVHMTLKEFLESREPTNLHAKISAEAKFTFEKDGSLEGKVTVTSSGIAAELTRSLYNSTGAEAYRNDMIPKNFHIDKNEFINMDSSAGSVIEHYELQVQDYGIVTDTLIFLDPFLLFKELKNPFTSDKREYPIEFGMKLERVFVCSIEIPEGLIIKEIPRSISLVLPNSMAKCSINLGVLGNRIQVTSIFQINKEIFNSEEYLPLRDFYNKIMAKKSEYIVLQKK
jgi:hypothetical protein